MKTISSTLFLLCCLALPAAGDWSLLPYGAWIACTIPMSFACPPPEIVATLPKTYMLSIEGDTEDTTTTAYAWVIGGMVDGQPVTLSGIVSRRDDWEGFTTVFDIDAGGVIEDPEVTITNLPLPQVRRLSVRPVGRVR